MTLRGKDFCGCEHSKVLIDAIDAALAELEVAMSMQRLYSTRIAVLRARQRLLDAACEHDNAMYLYNSEV